MLIVVVVAAVLTSALTGVIGFGGGMILLAVLVSVLEPDEAIPVHAAIQLVSNGSRTYIYRHSVDWKTAAYMAWPLFVTAPIGLMLAGRLPRSAGRLLIGVFVLAVTWKPWQHLGGRSPERAGTTTGLRDSGTWGWRGWSALGATNGLMLPSIGATGVFLAPFFRTAYPKRQNFLGTFGAQQSLGHISKLVVFTAAGFAFREHAPLMLLGAASVAVGTMIGTRLGDQFSEATFTVVYRVSIIMVALRLVWVALAHLGA